MVVVVVVVGKVGKVVLDAEKWWLASVVLQQSLSRHRSGYHRRFDVMMHTAHKRTTRRLAIKYSGNLIMRGTCLAKLRRVCFPLEMCLSC